MSELLSNEKKFSRLTKRGPFLYQFKAAKERGQSILSLNELGEALVQGHVETPPYMYHCGTLALNPGVGSRLVPGTFSYTSKDGVTWSIDVPKSVCGDSRILLVDPDYEIIVGAKRLIKIKNGSLFSVPITLGNICANFTLGDNNYSFLNVKKKYFGPVTVGYIDNELLVIPFLSDLDYLTYTKQI
ncbi:MAG: hypothetical protein ACP5H8_00185 [Candidatus Micrarchaeia archaeon]